MRLPRLRFTAVELVELPFAEQLPLFRAAAVFTGMHGAGYSNIIFMPPGGVVAELCPLGYCTRSFERLSARIGLVYMRWTNTIEAAIPPPPPHPCCRTLDLSVRQPTFHTSRTFPHRRTSAPRKLLKAAKPTTQPARPKPPTHRPHPPHPPTTPSTPTIAPTSPPPTATLLQANAREEYNTVVDITQFNHLMQRALAALDGTWSALGGANGQA